MKILSVKDWNHGRHCLDFGDGLALEISNGSHGIFFFAKDVSKEKYPSDWLFGKTILCCSYRTDKEWELETPNQPVSIYPFAGGFRISPELGGLYLKGIELIFKVAERMDGKSYDEVCDWWRDIIHGKISEI